MERLHDVPGEIIADKPYSPDPRAADYDGSRALFDSKHGYADALWAAEPAKEPWATRRAKQIDTYATPDVMSTDSEARVEIECHTSVCRVRVFSRNPYLVDEMGPYPFSCMAKLAMMGDSGTDPVHGGYTDYFLVFHPRGVSDEGFLDYQATYCAAERDAWLDEVKVPYVPPRPE